MTDCNNCLEEYVDGCVLYTGPDYPRFGIENNKAYSKVIVGLLDTLNEYLEQKVELHCVYTGECDNCDREVEIPEAVEHIIDKICTLTSSDIKYTGDLYCLSEDSISKSAVKLLGKTFNYDVQTSSEGSVVTYDLSDTKKDLPNNYRVSRNRVVVSGTSVKGNTIIADTDSSFAGIKVSPDRYPINMDVEVSVKTPEGDVKLVKNVYIPSPSTGSYTPEFGVKDYASNYSEILTVESFLETMARQLCKNNSEIENFKNVVLPACDYIQYSSTDLRDIVAQQHSVLCDVLAQLEGLNNFSQNLRVQ